MIYEHKNLDSHLGGNMSLAMTSHVRLQVKLADLSEDEDDKLLKQVMRLQSPMLKIDIGVEL